MSAVRLPQGDITEFRGFFKIDKPSDEETVKILKTLKEGQCHARDVEKLSDVLGINVKAVKRKYGKEGQYYLGPDETSVVKNTNYNCKFKDEPCGRLGWVYHAEDHTIRADGWEKFVSSYTPWIILLVQDVLAPRGYIVNGSVDYENRGYREEQYDSDGEYIEPEEEEDWDEATRNEKQDCWGTIEIVNNVIHADHPPGPYGY